MRGRAPTSNPGAWAPAAVICQHDSMCCAKACCRLWHGDATHDRVESKWERFGRGQLTMPLSVDIAVPEKAENKEA
jgi:hypothetical protein